MVPDGWKYRKLEEVLDRVVDPVEVDTNSTYQEIGIRSHGKGIFHKKIIRGGELGNKRVFWIKPDCFIVNIVFAWEQAVARTTQEEDGKIASHRFPMYRPKNGAADIDFLTYFFKTPHGKYLLELASPGGAGRNKTLGQKEFGNVELLLPSGKEQKKIAHILSTWDKTIKTVEKLIENSKAQKKSLMQQLLTGKRRLPGFSETWREVQLKAIAKILISNVDKITSPDEKPVRLCNYTDVYYNDYITNSISFMEATAKPREIEKFKLLPGDVIITKDSETPEDIAIPAVVSEALNGVVCGYHLAIIRPQNRVANGVFLSKLLSAPAVRHYFFSLANGATRFGLTTDAIANAKLFVPELPEQQRIGEVLLSIDRGIENQAKQLDALKEQKKSLMQQLLTGKRRVKVDES